VRVRYRHEGAEGRVELAAPGDLTNPRATAIVRFAKPVRAVSRGQVAVFYDGDRVLGGGRLCYSHAS
jgi:tRNA-specific 2-thiouridylase